MHSGKEEKIFCIIDGNALLHRAYHALPPLATRDGTPVQAVYGFANVLLKVIREVHPAYIAVAFDLPEPTFRHLAFEAYKATRAKTPDDLARQFPAAKELTRLMGIPVYEKAGYEADDIIGTIVRRVEETSPEATSLIVTGDLDTLQLVDEKTRVYTLKKGMGEATVYDPRAVKERFGIKPAQLPDFKGLTGDQSDNIPGISGIGAKTACMVIRAAKNLEGAYRELEKKHPNLGGISRRMQEKLLAGREDAFFSRELALIKRDVDIPFLLEESRWRGLPKAMVTPFLKKLEFYSLVKRLSEGQNESMEKKGDEAGRAVISGKDGKAVEAWFAHCRKEKRVALFMSDDSLWHCACGEEGAATFTPEDIESHRRNWESLLDDPNVKRVFHGAKRMYRFLLERGMSFRADAEDTEIAAYLLDPGKRDYTLLRVLRKEIESEKDLPWAVCKIFALQKRLEERLRNEGLHAVYADIEIPLIPILAQMEYRGISIDTLFLKKIQKVFKRRINLIERDIYRLAGRKFTINSPSQLSVVLFNVLGLETRAIRKTPGGVLSTRAQELIRLRGAHPIIEKILAYRELSKLLSTYAEALPALVHTKTGRVHTTFIQTGTVTGRLASANPNLQNVPLRTESGRMIRDAFRASPAWSLVSFDYSQIELRIIAGLAGDAAMIGAFRKGEDIHARTASLIHKVPLDRVTPEMRRAAKVLNFGIIYGIGTRSFADAAGIPLSEAKDFFSAYFHEFPGIRAYLAKVREETRSRGYVATYFGRRRSLPEIIEGGWQARQAAERMAVNMPIQGTAADLVKLVMIRIMRRLGRETSLKECVRLLLQVHDELLFEVVHAQVQKAASVIRPIMEGVFPDFPVPLVVDVRIGMRWGSMRPIK